jgi:beta-lactamase regulating signal transducer with metallopeptidase domain
MMLLNIHELIPTAVERMLDSVFGGIVLCGVASTWLRVARRQNSASRFFILFILLVGIAVLPFVGVSWLVHPGPVASSNANSLITLPTHTASYLFIAWTAITSALLTRVVIGLIQLHKLKQSCVPLNTNESDPRVQTVLQSCPRAVELCVSDRVSVPTALGFAEPAKIAIPDWLIHQLSPEDLHHLVLHEVAHLRRWDDWTNLAQRVVGAVLFFHPAVWWLQARLSLEREMACDECVLAETGNARGYAQSLASIAERSFVQRTVALAQAAVSRLHDTSLRVAKILSPVPLKNTSAVMTLASAAAFGGISIGIALYSPNLVGFAEPQSSAITSSTDAPSAQPALRPVMASLKVAPTAPKKIVRKPASKPVDAPVIARADEQKRSPLLPAKAHQHPQTAPPAVLVVWQETYTDGSFTIQQSYWRVVVFEQVIPKEQPAKTT